MPRKARRVQTALLAKGFRIQDSRHRRFTYYRLRGTATNVRTVMSHGGNRDIDDSLLSKMARQCGLSRREFLRLVDCPMTQPEYEALLTSRGVIPQSNAQ